MPKNTCSKVKLCGAIDFVSRQGGQMCIHFKRYRAPLLLNTVEKSILEKLHKYDSVADVYEDYNHADDLLITLRNMEEKRLISILL